MPVTKGTVVTEKMKQARSKAVAWLFAAVVVGLPALVALITGAKMIIHHEADPRVAWWMDDPDLNRTAGGEGAASGLLVRDLCKASLAAEDAR
jgi:hypothetical protein